MKTDLFCLFFISYEGTSRIRISRPFNAVSFRFCCFCGGGSDDDQREVADGYHGVLIRRDRIRAKPPTSEREKNESQMCLYLEHIATKRSKYVISAAGAGGGGRSGGDGGTD